MVYSYGQKYDLKLIDMAEAIGLTYKESPGSFGDISTFSFTRIKMSPPERVEWL